MSRQRLRLLIRTFVAALTLHLMAPTLALGQDPREKVPAPRLGTPVEVERSGDGRDFVFEVYFSKDVPGCEAEVYVDLDGQYTTFVDDEGHHRVRLGPSVYFGPARGESPTTMLTYWDEDGPYPDGYYMLALHGDTNCYSDVSNVIHIPDSAGAGGATCSVTSQSQCQLTVRNGNTGSAAYATAQGTCRDCPPPCKVFRDKIAETAGRVRRNAAGAAAAGIVTGLITGNPILGAAAGGAVFYVGSGPVLREVWGKEAFVSECLQSILSFDGRLSLAHASLTTGDEATVKIVSSDPSVVEVFERDGSTFLIKRAETGAVALHATAYVNDSPIATLSSHVDMAAAGMAADRAGLDAFYHATGGPAWTDDSYWLSDEDVLVWNGVRTNREGRVEQLVLPANGLRGPIPPEIDYLTNLEWLDLSENDLTEPLPSALGNLPNLRGLELQQNNLAGSIPPELGKLSNLAWLHLNNNSFRGEIPGTFSGLGNLTRLHLAHNELSGPIPDELASLADLGYLNLQSNRLTGSIPEWLGDLRQLYLLYLGGSGLTGPLPRQLGNLNDLQFLGLGGLGLTGSIPAWLGDLSGLRYLGLHGNPLTGTVPESLIRLSLELFWIHNTGVCVPADAAFQAWVATIEDFRGEICEAAMMRSFTDHPIVAGVTPVRAVHFTELRTRIDAARAAEGLERFRWTDPVLTIGSTPIRLVHLLDLRAALGEAYSAAGRLAPAWSDPAAAAGTTRVRAAHLMELRAAVEALE